jgi:hypothetical protein
LAVPLLDIIRALGPVQPEEVVQLKALGMNAMKDETKAFYLQRAHEKATKTNFCSTHHANKSVHLLH